MALLGFGFLGFVASLSSLQLNFWGCNIGEAGARSVGGALPPALRSLCLDFDSCNIGEGGTP